MEYTVKALEAEVETAEYRRSCVDVAKFLACCKACSSYGTVWSCPPYDFDPMEIWEKYRHLTLYARVLTPLPGVTYEGMMASIWRERDKFFAFLMEKEGEVPGSLALSVGPCTLCENCRRLEGKPCIRPQKMRHSIESLGGDVAATVEKYFGFPLLWADKGALPAYFTLVGGLLR